MGTPISYKEITNNLWAMATRIRGDDIKVDAIVGISRGGLIPAVILSHFLALPMVPLVYSAQSRESKGGQTNPSNIDQSVLFSPYNDILLVDDISDSGVTFTELKPSLEDEYIFVTTASIYLRHSSKFKPDYFGVEITTDEYLDFPWELPPILYGHNIE